jgi:putative hydrolase of the HAD superfamily
MLKSIIFDLGNVLIDIDFPRSEQQLKALLGDNLLEKLEKINQANLFYEFEKGNISEDFFIKTLQSLGENVAEQQIKDAYNAMLIGFKAERFEMLKRLSEKYTLYVLSNTNKMHIDWVHQHLEKDLNITNYESQYFKTVYYSHELHLRKPDVGIYKYVLQDAQLKAEETLFIDDNYDNIVAAQSIGIQVIHHELGNEIVERLKDL